MIYQFFYLHDELEWLNLKLHEESEFVDKFVIVESDVDIAPCLFHEWKPVLSNRLSKASSKMERVFSTSASVWAREV